MTDLIQSSNIILEAENSLLKMEIERKDKIINTLQMHMSYENICQSDKLILEYTGLPTRNVFESLFTLLKDVDIKYYLKWNVQKINSAVCQGKKTGIIAISLYRLQNTYIFHVLYLPGRGGYLIGTYMYILYQSFIGKYCSY